MPTITNTSLVATAVAALADMYEGVHTTERDALRTIVDYKVTAREALIPLYNEENDNSKANKDDPTKAADITAKEFNTVMVGRAKAEKHNWKHSTATISELLWTMDLHDEDRLSAFYLWAVDDQGTDREGNPNPPAATTWDNYVAWLRRGVSLGQRDDKGNLTAFAYSLKTGKMTPAAKARQTANEKAADEARRRQLTGTDPAEMRKDLQGATRVEMLLRDQHDIARAVLLLKESLVASEEGRKVWTAGVRAFNKAKKGERS